MKRLFWVALGAAGAAVALHQLRRAAETNPAARMAQKAVDAGVARASQTASEAVRKASAALSGVLDDYRTASAERAQELRDALLAETQGTEEDLRARRESGRGRQAPPARTASGTDDDGPDDDFGYEL